MRNIFKICVEKLDFLTPTPSPDWGHVPLKDFFNALPYFNGLDKLVLQPLNVVPADAGEFHVLVHPKENK